VPNPPARDRACVESVPGYDVEGLDQKLLLLQGESASSQRKFGRSWGQVAGRQATQVVRKPEVVKISLFQTTTLRGDQFWGRQNIGPKKKTRARVLTYGTRARRGNPRGRRLDWRNTGRLKKKSNIAMGPPNKQKEVIADGGGKEEWRKTLTQPSRGASEG